MKYFALAFSWLVASTVAADNQRTLVQLVERHELPGATLAIVQGKQPPITVAHGFADIETSTPMQPTTRMMSASIGKTFVAAMALDLVDRGKLSLDEPISRVFGDAAWLAGIPNTNQITLRHLLAHRSGLPDHIFSQGYAEAIDATRGDPERYFTPLECVSFIANEPALFTPGEGFQYTDTGYILIGLLIETASDNDYYEQIYQRFLLPLGLTLTTPAITRKNPGLASGYTQLENPFGLPRKVASSQTLIFNPRSEWTGGGLVTNSLDLARWMRALVRGEVISDRSTRLLLSDAEGDGYGHGVAVYRTPHGLGYGHSGWFPGFTSNVTYIPDRDLAVAMQANTDDGTDVASYVQAVIGQIVEG